MLCVILYIVGLALVLAFFAGHGKQRRGHRPTRVPQHERPKPSVFDAELARRIDRPVS